MARDDVKEKVHKQSDVCDASGKRNFKPKKGGLE